MDNVWDCIIVGGGSAGLSAELYAAGRRELAAYPSVEKRTGEVVHAERVDDLFVLEQGDDRREGARRVLLRRAWSLDHRRCPGLPRCGADRCSTARSVTAGKSGSNRWRRWLVVSGLCTRR